MGGTQAAKVLAQIEASSLKKSGEIVDEAKALFDKIKPDTTNRFRLIMLLPDCGLMRSSSRHSNLDIYGYRSGEPLSIEKNLTGCNSGIIRPFYAIRF
jgi:hypothetical protein